MSKKLKKHGPNKAKSIIAQPLFRCRQEQPQRQRQLPPRSLPIESWEASTLAA
jgi:hypothetical protein